VLPVQRNVTPSGHIPSAVCLCVTGTPAPVRLDPPDHNHDSDTRQATTTSVLPSGAQCGPKATRHHFMQPQRAKCVELCVRACVQYSMTCSTCFSFTFSRNRSNVMLRCSIRFQFQSHLVRHDDHDDHHHRHAALRHFAAKIFYYEIKSSLPISTEAPRHKILRFSKF